MIVEFDIAIRAIRCVIDLDGAKYAPKRPLRVTFETDIFVLPYDPALTTAITRAPPVIAPVPPVPAALTNAQEIPFVAVIPSATVTIWRWAPATGITMSGVVVPTVGDLLSKIFRYPVALPWLFVMSNI